MNHPKYLNTPRQVYDDQAQLRWKWDQAEPFGVNTPDENPASFGAFELPSRFPGQYADKETSLSQNWSRDYNPGIGMYAEAEPLGVRADINLYRYAKSSSLSYVDRNGRNPVAGATIGGAIGGPVGAVIGAAVGLAVGVYIANAISENESGSSTSSPSSTSTDTCPLACPPCTPYSVGTIGYLGPDYHDHFSKYHGMNLNPHLNLFVVNQRKDCKCFWNRNWPDAVPPPAPAGWVDLNGGFPPLSP